MNEKSIQKSGNEAIVSVIGDRVRDARNAEVLGIYEELLQAVWDRIIPTLGRVTTVAIMERAVILTKENHPILERLEVGANGLDFEKIRSSIGDADFDNVREAMKNLVADLIDILAMLTGDILVKQLIKEIDERRSS